MSRLSDITNAAIKNLLSYVNRTPAPSSATNFLATAGAAATFVNAAVDYICDGIACYKAAVTVNAFTVTEGLAYPLPTGKTCYYTIGLNAAGTYCVMQGSYSGQALTGQMGATAVGDGSIPGVPAGYTPVGVLKVVNTSVGDFIIGTTLLNVAGITQTYKDIAVLPSTPF